MDFVPGTVPVLSLLTDSTIEQVESLDSMATDEVDKKPNIKKIEGLWITIFPP